MGSPASERIKLGFAEEKNGVDENMKTETGSWGVPSSKRERELGGGWEQRFGEKGGGEGGGGRERVEDGCGGRGGEPFWEWLFGKRKEQRKEGDENRAGSTIVWRKTYFTIDTTIEVRTDQHQARETPWTPEPRSLFPPASSPPP